MRGNLETHSEEGDIQDGDVERHAQRDRAHEEGVIPQGQPEQALVLGERIHRIEHLDRDENREAHRRRPFGHDICEHLTADFGEERRALVEVRLRVKC